MKRAIRYSLIALLVIAVAAAAFAGGAKESAPKKEGIVIGFSNAGMGDSWRQFLVANFNAEVAPPLHKSNLIWNRQYHHSALGWIQRGHYP